MIPLQVRMTGWMRYRDEQVADFSGARLISICGENGAGKSAIFDAITFALYGRHRLGAQDTEQLITEDADLAAVDFEFEQAGKRYRVRRSRGRRASAGTQSMSIFDDASGEWIVISGTDKTTGLNAKIAEIVKLSEKAFTSSFLLQQGEATKFLDASGSERFEIISSLIALDDYRRLEGAAKKERDRQKAILDQYTADLGEMAEVDEARVEALAEAAASAERCAQAADAVLAAANARAAGAERHAALAAEIAALEARRAAAQQLMAERERIEADAEAFKHADVRAQTAQQIAAEMAAAAKAASDAAQAKQAATAIDVAAADTAVADARKALAAAEAAVGEREAAYSAAAADERAAADFARDAKRVVDLRAEIAAADKRIAAAAKQLAALPEAEQRAASLRAVVEALPLMSALKNTREKLESARAGDPRAKLAQLQPQLDAAKQQQPALAKAKAAASQAHAAAVQQHAAAAAHASQLEAQRQQRAASAGEATCSRCGQRIDVAAARRELAELTASAKAAAKDAAAAERALATAVSERDASVDALDALAAQVATLERGIEFARVAADALTSCEDDDARAYDGFRAHAPAEMAAAIDPATPSKAVAAAYNTHAKAKAQALEAAQLLDKLTQLRGQHAAEQRQRDASATALSEAEAALGSRLADAASAAQQHAAAKAALAAAERARAGAKDAVATAKAAVASAEGERDVRTQRQAALAATAAECQSVAAQRRAAAEAHASALPPADRDAALADPHAFANKLASARDALAGASARLEELRRAEKSSAEARAAIALREGDIAAIPVEHRVPPAEAHEAAGVAASHAAAARETRDAAAGDHIKAQAALEQAKQLRGKLDEAKHRYQLVARLYPLLGRSGLQGELVRSALTTITGHANAFLGRLTGGTLRLELSPGKGDELLLQAVDLTSMREARHVAALSGSQKFRCAVAVASGIGQYAGAGGMRSIVIDEGFGSLDLAGQQLIVDELKQLAEHMDKVIVVSHLEPFQDRDDFPDRIIVERTDGASIIRRER